MASSSPKPPSFEQVTTTLDRIQGQTVPDYQGHGAFWADYDTLLAVSLYGQRMIAPDPGAPASSSGGGGCCSSANASDASDAAADADEDGSQPAVATGLAHHVVTAYWPEKNPDADCFPTGGGTGGGGGDTSRSDRSGLVIGLRGEAPFDGSVFPPLLWEAERTATGDEIALIARWIDAGCPRTADESHAGEGPGARVSAKPGETYDLGRGGTPHPRHDGHVNGHRDAVQGLRVRKNVAHLTPHELDRFRRALSCLREYDGYWRDHRSFDFWGRIHANSCQHGWEQFLPWHRAYLYQFEQILLDVDPEVTLPYWSWSEYADANRQPTTALDTGVIPHAFRCWLDEQALATLGHLTTNDDKGRPQPLFSKAQLKRLRKVVGPGNATNSGRRLLLAAGFKPPYTTVRAGVRVWTDAVRAIYDELVRVNPLWFPNRWPGSLGQASHYPTPADIDRILAVPSYSAFGGGPDDDHHFGRLEETHNGMHNFSGGANPDFATGGDPQAEEDPQFGYMVEARVTAFDPIFWAHHSNVDRLWAEWQRRHPGVEPEALDGALAPWPLTVRDTLSTKPLGYEYVQDVHAYPVGGYPVVTFTSEATAVSASSFRKAEVRLHRIRPSGVPNADLRVFLNNPAAGATTPLDAAHGFAGHFHTFGTRCFGGPGHCDPPAPRRSRFDVRPLHHHEPRNVRVDVTDLARSLLADGAGALSVQVVAVGLDGAPADDALYLDAVSLNLFD